MLLQMQLFEFDVLIASIEKYSWFLCPTTLLNSFMSSNLVDSLGFSMYKVL